MKYFSLIAAFCSALVLSGAEYVITPADSLQKAFDKLNPGDTLTLRPGVYRQGTVTSSPKGTADKPIIIRGEDRTSTIITAWQSLDNAQWEAVPGQRFVFRTPFRKAVYNVSDLKAERLLLTAPAIHDMEKFRGTFRYEKGYLYLHCFDGKRPGRGLRATIHSGYLFLLSGAAHVKIEDLTFCGSAYEDPRLSSWAIAIRCIGTSDITVDRCSFLYNSGGVAFTSRSKNSVAKNCFFHRNDAPGYAEAAQLFYGGGSKNNLAENNLVINTGVHGIRFYSGATDCVARNNIVVNARIGLYYKATAGNRLAHSNVVVSCPNTNYSDLQGGRPIKDISNTFDAPSNVFDPNETNLLLKKNRDPGFCAPEYYDFHLQKDSRFKGKGAFPGEANVFYLSSSGKDTYDGGSIKKAFRTFARAAQALKKDSLLYVAEGSYKEFKSKLKNVTLRGRGNVSLERLDLTDAENVTVEGFTVKEVLLKNSRNVTLKNCVAGTITSGSGTKIRNCTYEKLAGKASVLNSLCANKPVNSYPESPVLPGAKTVSGAVSIPAAEDPTFTFFENMATVSWVTPEVSADHYRQKDSWWAPQVCTSYLEYGDTPALGKKAYSSGNIFHNVTVKGLIPGKKYYCRTVIPAHPLERKNISAWHKAAFSGFKMSGTQDAASKIYTFTIPAKGERKSAEYFVSPSGSDKNSGSRTAPFGSVAYAVSRTLPGDTLTFLPGIYYDAITPVHPGTKEKPVLFRAEKPGTVIFDGSNYMRSGGIVCIDMEHLKFQGLIFRNYANKLYANRAGASFGMAQIYHSSNIQIADCVFSAMGTYQHPLVLLSSKEIKAENCVFVRGVAAVDGSRNGNLEIKNCTFYVSEIYNFSLGNQLPGSTLTVRNNLFVALSGQKALNKVERTGISAAKGVKVDFDNNCWYFSPKDKYRYCGGEGGKIKLEGVAGVKRFREKTNWSKNDIEITAINFKGHKFYDPFEPEFSKITSKNIVSGKTVPTLEFFESEFSGKYGAKAVK